MDILIKAGIKNGYWIHNRKYSKQIYEETSPDNLEGNFAAKNSKLFSILKRNISIYPTNDEINIQKEIMLEIITSLEFISTSLISEKTLINSLQLIRLFLDNILRYYYFYDNPNVKSVDVYSFSKESKTNFQKHSKPKNIFSIELQKEYHQSGAESHFASLFNRNQGHRDIVIRNQSILNSLKILLCETKDIMADIVVKLAKRNSKKQLSFFEEIILIYILMGKRIIILEGEMHGY